MYCIINPLEGHWQDMGLDMVQNSKRNIQEMINHTPTTKKSGCPNLNVKWNCIFKLRCEGRSWQLMPWWFMMYDDVHLSTHMDCRPCWFPLNGHCPCTRYIYDLRTHSWSFPINFHEKSTILQEREIFHIKGWCVCVVGHVHSRAWGSQHWPWGTQQLATSAASLFVRRLCC